MDVTSILLQPELINPIIMWACYIVIPGFVGAYASDFIKTLRHEEMKVSLIRVILATVLSCVINFIFVEWLIEINRKALIPFICFVLGLLGFELLHGLSTIDNIVALLSRLSKVLTFIMDVLEQANEVRKLAATKRGKRGVEKDAGNTKSDNPDQDG